MEETPAVPRPMPPVRIDLLGSLALRVGGRDVPPGPPRRQAALVYLAARQGVLLTKEQLIDAVWGEDVPGNASGNVHTHVAALRKQLDPHRSRRDTAGRLATLGSGYRLTLDPDSLDTTTLTRLRNSALACRREGDLAGALERITRATALWRGTPLPGVPGPFAEVERQRLTDLYLAAVDERADLLLALGRAQETADELAQVLRDHPLHESGYLLAMTALYRCGRPGEALALFRRARQLLEEELGVEPCAELRQLRTRILAAPEQPRREGAGGAAAAGPADTGHGPRRGAPSGAGGAPEAGDAVAEGAVPAARAPAGPDQLPPYTRHFVGRTAELAELDEALRRADGPALWLIDGPAGVGKTTLALEWAHRRRHAFPDGRLFADLCGFDAVRAPAAPEEVLRDFLLALGVEPSAVPRTAQARSGLLRSLTHGRRLLMVLDNAHASRQVRPLLPAGPGCAVLITSRRQLDTLAVRDGARQLPLPAMSPREGRELLASWLGRDRAAVEPAAVDELTSRCAGSPLALAVLAHRAVRAPRLPLAELAERLGSGRGRSQLLGGPGGDIVADLREVFAGSRASLSAAAQRAFALLSAQPGPDIDLPAAAALLGAGRRSAQRVLAELTGAHLLDEPEPERFRFHDLLGEYAREQAAALPHGSAVRARDRLLAWYLAAAQRASELIQPGAVSHLLPPVRPPHPLPDFPDRAAGLRWLRRHVHQLVAAAEEAARVGRHEVAWQLPTVLTTYFYLSKDWSSWLRAVRVALRAARHARNAAAEAYAHSSAGLVRLDLREYAAARRHFERALPVLRESGSSWALGTTLTALGHLRLRTGQVDGAAADLAAAYRVYDRLGDWWGRAWSLTGAGSALLARGRREEAVECLNRALRAWRRARYPRGEADVLASLAEVRSSLGDPERARACLERARELYRGLEDDYRQAQVLVSIGAEERRRGAEAAAVRAWREALAVFDRLHAPDADGCRRLLCGAADRG